MNHARLAALALTTAACALSVTFAEKAAAAGDAAPKTSFVTMMDQGQQWLRAATAGPTAGSDPSASHGTTTASRGDAASSTASGVPDMPEPFLDLSPRASLVARDWHGSLRVLGAPSTIIDDVRPSASNRMVMGRVMMGGARISIFGQVGLGQWRIDTVLFPNAQSDEEMAGQAGGGVEFRITPRVRLAAEADYTALYRNLHYTENEVAPRMTTLTIAFAGTF